MPNDSHPIIEIHLMYTGSTKERGAHRTIVLQMGCKSHTRRPWGALKSLARMTNTLAGERAWNNKEGTLFQR
jgi:hypothetical protein